MIDFFLSLGLTKEIGRSHQRRSNYLAGTGNIEKGAICQIWRHNQLGELVIVTKVVNNN
jgi:hypothetical protein